MAKSFTRHCTLAQAQPFEWLVLIGDDASIERYVQCHSPNEELVRKLLQINEHTPIAIGRAKRPA